MLFALRESLVSTRKDITEQLTLHNPATAERIRLAMGDELLRMGRVLPKDEERGFFVAVV